MSQDISQRMSPIGKILLYVIPTILVLILFVLWLKPNYLNKISFSMPQLPEINLTRPTQAPTPTPEDPNLKIKREVFKDFYPAYQEQSKSVSAVHYVFNQLKVTEDRTKISALMAELATLEDQLITGELIVPSELQDISEINTALSQQAAAITFAQQAIPSMIKAQRTKNQDQITQAWQESVVSQGNLKSSESLIKQVATQLQVDIEKK